VRFVRGRWTYLLRNLDRRLGELRGDLAPLGLAHLVAALPDERTVFSLLQLHELRVSWKRELRDTLRQVFAGRAFEPVMAQLEAIHADVLRGRVFIAMHMHAGDGNVHTNIPSTPTTTRCWHRQRGRGARHALREGAGRRGFR